MRGDQRTTQEYIVCGKDGTQCSQFATTYTLRNGVATFWHWRRNVSTGRYELVPHKIENVNDVILATEGEIEK
jgi:hypothetical protein